MAVKKLARLLLVLLPLFFFNAVNTVCAQDSVSNEILNRKLLVMSSLKHPEQKIALDSSGVIHIVCVNSNDSLVASRYRQLSGKLIHYNDSCLVLHVIEETISSYKRDGTTSQFYYDINQDSTRMHIDTLLLSEVHSLRFDKGRFRLLIHFLQSTTYTFALANVMVLVTALILPNNYPSLVTGQNAMIATGTSLVLGGSSLFFLPKSHRVNKQANKPRQRIRWKLETI